jgi:transcriptional regulator with XRE-family HTH domain
VTRILLVRQRYRTLNDYFQQTGDSQARLAKALRVSPGYVSMLRSGERQPALDMALKIHDLTGVPLESMVVRREEAIAS